MGRRPPSSGSGPGLLRVLYVTPFAEQVSGPDESLLLLLRQLGGSIAAAVALPPDSPFRGRYLEAGADLIERPISRLRRFETAMDVARYGGSLAAGTAGLLARARPWRPDLVHANMEVCLEAGLVARALGVPSVIHYRGNTIDEPRVVFDVLARVWSALGDRILAISEGCADIFRRRGLGERVEVLYNALELADFTTPRDGGAVRRALGIDARAHVVLTVGRLHPRKDVETFLRAAAEAGNGAPVHWLIAGSAHGRDGVAYEQRMHEVVAELGIGDRIRFLGARADVPDLLAACDVFAMTSRHEGFGRAAAEAMAAGRPCVLTDEGAFPELVEPGVHGLLCPAGNARAFASAVSELLADPERRRRMGDAGRRRAIDRYDARRQADHVLAVYEELVGTEHADRSGIRATFEAS